MNHQLWHECVAEAFGTFILVLFGTASVAMVQLFGSGTPGEVVNGGYTNITIAWGLGVTMAIYLTAKVSGAHLNPAVTVALAAFRGFPWRKVVPYSLAQTLGAFLAAALTYGVYYQAFQRFDPSLSRTAGIFATFPAYPQSPATGLVDQIVGTFLLLLLIFALSDEKNMPPAGNLSPVLVGLIVVVIGMTFGSLHGYAINPARDFGPRVFIVLAGFPNNGLTDGTNVFLIPIAGPLVGGLLGGLAYVGLIGKGLAAVSDTQAIDREE